jgi:hypothetical protein
MNGVLNSIPSWHEVGAACEIAAIAIVACAILVTALVMWSVMFAGAWEEFADRRTVKARLASQVPVEEWPEESVERLRRDVAEVEPLSEDESEDRLAAVSEAMERDHHVARHLRSVPQMQETAAVVSLADRRERRVWASTQRPPVGGGEAA